MSGTTRTFNLRMSTTAHVILFLFILLLWTINTGKLNGVSEVVYLKRPRCYILTNVSLTRRFALILNRYTLGLMLETLVSNPGFRYILIQCFDKICTKPEDSQIER